MKPITLTFKSLLLFIMVTNYGCEPPPEENDRERIRLMTLNPGHFHAALVQKNQLPGVDETVHIYAPEGPDLEMHMDRIEGFNTRDENPANWESIVYTGEDYLQRMLDEQPGNVMVTAGNNRLKTRYILETVQEGINVLSDKPMAINEQGWQMLVEAFESAEQKDVMLYDIMTERFEVSSRLLRTLMHDKELFGELVTGSREEPAFYKESVHHLFKYVAGSPLRRPPWYFDVRQQGEGIVDVSVHLVDLSMWIAFPDQIVRHEEDVTLLDAERWPTTVTQEQFERITGEPEFPEYLVDQLDDDGMLPLYCNGQIDYVLNGHHVGIKVVWDYQAPPGGDDTHYSKIRGTRSNLVLRQGKEQDFRATVYVEPAVGISPEEIRSALDDAIERLQNTYPGAGYEESQYGWKLNIPDQFHYGHEAHFGMVAETFLEYLKEGQLPAWEVPNMISKYYITTQAREIAMDNSSN